MKTKNETIEFRNKIMEGVNKAVKQLVIEKAARNESLVITNDQGNAELVPAKN